MSLPFRSKFPKIGSDESSKIIESFYGVGLNIPSRRIMLSGESNSESTELHHLDIAKLNKSVLILNDISDKPIEIYMSCCGGITSRGMAAYDIIANSKAPIDIIVIGECWSMGTIILQAAKRRIASPNSSFLIHNPYLTISEMGILTIKELRVHLEELEEMKEFMMNIYIDNTNTDRESLENIMQKESFFNSKKALELGFIDEILPVTFPLRGV